MPGLKIRAEDYAPGDTDLATLVADGLVVALPEAMASHPPRIAATDATERSALGYLHGNCGHCHNRSGLGVPVAMNLSLQWREGALDADTVRRSLIGRTARYAPAGEAPGTLLVPGDPRSFDLYEVSTRVNSVRNNAGDLVEPRNPR